MLGVPPRPKIIQASMIACKVPATGVHNPASSKLPTPIAMNLAKIPSWGAPQNPEQPSSNNGMAAARRRTRSPAPGQPPGNIVNNRCKFSPYFAVISHSLRGECNRIADPANPQMWGDALDSFGWFIRDLQFDDSALQSCGHGVRSVIDAKLGKDALDVALDGILRYR